MANHTSPLSIATSGYISNKKWEAYGSIPLATATDGYITLNPEGRLGGGMRYEEYLRRNPKLYQEEDEELLSLVMAVVSRNLLN